MPLKRTRSGGPRRARRLFLCLVAAAVLEACVPVQPASAVDLRSVPVIPGISGAVRSNLLQVFRDGRSHGNRANVFAKVGDSISESGSFLQGLACGEARYGSHGELRATVRYFNRRAFPDSYAAVWCGRADSFSRASATAVSGWRASDALAPFAGAEPGCPAPHDRPLLCEVHLLRPSVALVMYGTNDLQQVSTTTFRRNLARVVGRLLERGVIPVLSTIPPRHDDPTLSARVGPFNQRIVALAQRRRVPLWNYWRALTAAGMVNQGVSDDGVHPSLYGNCEAPIGCASETFTTAGLRYGYNQRNLGALEVLRRIKGRVLDAG